MEGRVQSLCEGWWNRSDISSELKKEIPAGTDSRGGIRDESKNRERCDPLGVTLFSDRQLLTHTLAHILRLYVGVPGDALMQKGMNARGIKIDIELFECAFVRELMHVLCLDACSFLCFYTNFLISVQMYILVVWSYFK